MYEVFSMTRAGRPTWALIATAALFVLTTLLAFFVAHQKSRQAEIILGEVKPYRALGLSASFPTDWKVSPAEDIANGRVLLVSPTDSKRGRNLLVFRMRAAALGSGQRVRAAALIRAIRAIDPEAQLGAAGQTETSRLGSFDSEVFRLDLVSPTIGPDIQGVAANVAVTPDRQVIGVMLLVDGEVTPRDRRLLDRISTTISYRSDEGTGEEAGPSRDSLDGPVDQNQDGTRAARKPRQEAGAKPALAGCLCSAMKTGRFAV